MVFLKKCGIEILRAMAERIEGEHQQDQKKKAAQIDVHAFTDVGAAFFRHAALEPGRRLVHLGADVDHQKSGKGSHNKHAAPTDEAKQSPVHDRSEKVADHVAFLQKPGKKAPPFGGQRFESQRGADAPFSSHGNAKQCAHDEKRAKRRSEGGAQFENRETDDVDHQRGTASEAIGQESAKNAPTGRIASVRKIASVMAETLVWNSPAMALTQKTRTKKSNASSDHPRKQVMKVLRCVDVRPRK